MTGRLLLALAGLLLSTGCSKNETITNPPTTTGWIPYSRCEVAISNIDSISVPQRSAVGVMTVGTDIMRYEGSTNGTNPDGTWKLSISARATKLSALDTAIVTFSTHNENPANPLDYFEGSQTIRIVALPAGAQADSAREFVALGLAALPTLNQVRSVGTFYGSTSAGDWDRLVHPIARTGSVLRLTFRK